MIIYNGQVLETRYPTWVSSLHELSNVAVTCVETHFEGDLDHYIKTYNVIGGNAEISLMYQENEEYAAYMYLDSNGSQGIVTITPGYEMSDIDTNLFVHIVQITLHPAYRVLMLFRNEDGEYLGYGLTPSDCYKVESVLAIRREDRYGTYYIDAQNWAGKKELRAAPPVTGPPKRKLFIPKGGK